MMKLSGIFFTAATAALAVLGTACGSVDDEAEKETSRFYLDGTEGKDGKGGSGSGGDAQFGQNGANGANGESNRPGQYGDFTTENSDYMNFGRRITNAPAFQPVYFGFDIFALPVTEESKVDAIVDFLNKNPGTGVVVEGNCDERGTEEYNRGLGERRALSVKTAIIDRGIAESRIATVSYGEDKPAVQGSNETAWTRNRRAEFVPVMLKK